MIKKLCKIIVLFIVSMNLNAELVQTQFKHLTVNANLINAQHKSQPFYLILHGTWAWQGMELIASTQELLEEEGVGSLAITLSLGVNNRSGFLGCPKILKANHLQSYAELDHWYQYLTQLGYNNIILFAHSRGGSQASGFSLAYPKDKLSRLVLLAPMTWEKNRIHHQYQKKHKQNLQLLINRAESLKAQKNAPLMKSIDVLYCKNQSLSADSFLSYYSDKIERNTWDLVKRQTIPVDIFLGSEDPISTRFSQSVNKKSIPANIKLHTIDGADHSFRDLYLDEIIETLLGTEQ